MSITSPTASAKKTIQKIDIAQVSLNLQDRLGLAKVRYERMHHIYRDTPPNEDHRSHNHPTLGEAFSDSSSDISHGRYTTPLTSSPLRTPMLSRELPRSTRSKHAATFDLSTMECMTSGSRKRRRYDIPVERNYSKAPRISWDIPESMPQSSPSSGRHYRMYRNNPSFVSESDTIPDVPPSPEPRPRTNSHDIDPALTSSNIPHTSSVISSSPPRTPPPRRNRLSNPRTGQDGADLLLYLANSPTPANIGGKGHMSDFLPSTPPAQHAALPSLISTPGQQFNFADFLNVTPSPAQRPWGNRTPLPGPKTPRNSKEVRKRLNFDGLAPPSGASPAFRNTGKRASTELQLGEELHF